MFSKKITDSHKIKVGIGIATTGRSAQILLTLKFIANQQIMPSVILVCPATAEDFDSEAGRVIIDNLQVIQSSKGSCLQRNAILKFCSDLDVIIFMDDDFFPATDYVAQVMHLFESSPQVAIATNRPILDGATGPGISPADALDVLLKSSPITIGKGTTIPTYGGYGCNMSVRLSAVRRVDASFDERLPFYGWLEDIDFSRQLASTGQIVQANALRGVHLGTKTGRTSGIRFGYSQIANPVYLARKGNLSFRYAYLQLLRNLLKNLARSILPERWIDRRGRLKGNLIALRDLLIGKIDPQRIRQL